MGRLGEMSEQIGIQEYQGFVDRFFANPVLTGWPELDQILGPRIDIIKRLKYKERLSRNRFTALQKLGYGTSAQAIKARVVIAPLIALADKAAQAYTNVLINLKEQVVQGGNLWLQRDRRNIVGLSAADEYKLIALSVVATIAAGPALKTLKVAGTGFKLWLLNNSINVAAFAVFDKMFDYVSVFIASLFDTTSGAIADWWLPSITEKQADKWADDFDKLYATKLSELQGSSDSSLRALVPKLEAAYKGKEIGPVAWVKTNWKWLVAGSLVAVIVLNPVKNRG